MHEIVVYYRTYGHAGSVIHLSVLNIRNPKTVKIPLPHNAQDQKFDFWQNGQELCISLNISVCFIADRQQRIT